MAAWLPRQIDIDKVSDEEIQDIILTANLTPRKCLGFKTPFQAILKELGPLGNLLRDSSREIVDFGRRIARAMAPIEWPRTFNKPICSLSSSDKCE